jgi:hypothetical protein
MLAQTRSFLIRLFHGKATRKPKRNSLKSAPRSSVKAVRPVDSSESAALTPLNFKVPQEFHRDFKTFAAQHSKKMVEVLQEAFVLLKEKYGGNMQHPI